MFRVKELTETVGDGHDFEEDSGFGQARSGPAQRAEAGDNGQRGRFIPSGAMCR